MSYLSSILTSWKTTLAGLALILGAAADVAHNLSTGQAPNYVSDYSALMAGIGLIHAKDHNK